MTIRRYTVEANVRTLAKFFAAAADNGSAVDSFVHRFTTSAHDEYHYVILEVTERVHQALKTVGFNDSYQTTIR